MEETEPIKQKFSINSYSAVNCKRFGVCIVRQDYWTDMEFIELCQAFGCYMAIASQLGDLAQVGSFMAEHNPAALRSIIKFNQQYLDANNMLTPTISRYQRYCDANNIFQGVCAPC